MAVSRSSGYLSFVRSEHQTRRFALVASLLLHAGLLALLFSLRAPELPPAPQQSRPVDLEIVVTKSTPQPPPASPPLPEASEARPTPRARPKEPAARREASARPAAPAASSTEPAQAPTAEAGATPREPGEPGEPGESGAPTADRPARLSGGDLALAPTTDTARAMGMDTLDGPGLGTTIRRGDPEPDGSATRAQEAREVGKRVESMLADVQARHRVTTGGVDDYFGKLRESLAASTAKPPPGKRLSNPIGAAIENWTGGMERFGATGNPYREAEIVETKRGEGLNALGEKIQRTNDLFDGEFGSDMVAVVEIWQAGNGGLLDWKLVASSGLREFDAYVMDAVPEAIAGLEPPPREGAGLHADGIHSLWSFQGRIQYRTPLRAESYKETATNALFLVLGGSFEETTGEVWVNRVDKPQFLCRVKLLSVY